MVCNPQVCVAQWFTIRSYLSFNLQCLNKCEICAESFDYWATFSIDVMILCFFVVFDVHNGVFNYLSKSYVKGTENKLFIVLVYSVWVTNVWMHFPHFDYRDEICYHPDFWPKKSIKYHLSKFSISAQSHPVCLPSNT